MDVNSALIWLAYLCSVVFALWALGRILVWQIARFMRIWFKIDIVVASVGIFCANGISIRVNDLQSLEIDKVSLKIRPKSSHSLSLHFGDVRIRAERNLSKGKPQDLKPKQKNAESNSNSLPKRWKIIQWLARHVSLNVDALNIMLLNAFVPESLLHLDLSNVHIAGGDRSVVDSGIAEALSKSQTHQVHEGLPSERSGATNLGLLLSVGEIRGKILKSSKGDTSGTSCIVEVTSSFKVGVVVCTQKPTLKLEYVGIDFDKLAVELHSSALIPGLLLPRKPVSNVDDILDKKRGLRNAAVPLKQSGPIRAALALPMLTQCRLRNLDVLVFGDPPPNTGILTDSHNSAGRVLNFSVSAMTLSQRKDPERTVTVSAAGFINALESDDIIELPTGYIRTKFEDFSITTNKVKLLTMSRVSAETKLTSNCVLSSSLDFTLCYMHYYHKEANYWIEQFKQKVSKVKRERPRVTFANAVADEKPEVKCPGSDKVSRKNPPGNYKGEGANSREIPPQASFTPSHKRTRSAPNNFYHADEHYMPGSAPPRPELAVPKDVTSLVNVLNALGISTVCEFTFYEAVVDATLPKAKAPGSDNFCVFSFGFDCITMSVDHSANSQDINFMTKLDRVCWKPRNNLLKETSGCCDTQSLESRWPSMEAAPYHKTDIHEWGTAFSLDTLRLHGQATFGPANGSSNITSKSPKKSGSFWPRQHISISVDAKIAGAQIEFSQTAAQCIACIASCIQGKSRADSPLRQSAIRQDSLATSTASKPVDIQTVKKYSFSLVFAEVEISHVNLFLLPSDMSGCVDCLIMRIDSLRSESNLTDRRLNIEGVGIATVHNPYFSAFATYESGYGDRKGGTAINLGSTSIPASIRQQQIKVSQYHCVCANDMQSLHFGLNCIDIEYKVINREEPEDEFPSCIKSLSASLCHDRDVVVFWSPKLHMLVHHELVEMYHILRRPATSSQKNVKINVGDKIYESPPKIQTSPFEKRQARSNFEGKNSYQSFSGDAPVTVPSENTLVSNVTKQVSFTTNSRICINLALKENMFVEFIFNPIRYAEVNDVSSIAFNKARVIMDNHNIFTFVNVKIELAARNEKVQEDRSSFSDLVTECNRVWSIHMTHWSCHFPHGYDFAKTFDQFITNFKWVKGLYRKTSHPFRSPKLPPDLLIAIEKFVFEIADSDFECRLRDNHELIKDEWKESEKRRKILDQRVADLRREKGEFLPAKKIEELYLKLEEQNTRIYVDRCKKLHRSKMPRESTVTNRKTHSRSASVPPELLSPNPKLSSHEEIVPPLHENPKEPITPSSQVRSSSFSFIPPSEDPDVTHRLNTPLFSWRICSISISGVHKMLKRTNTHGPVLLYLLSSMF